MPARCHAQDRAAASIGGTFGPTDDGARLLRRTVERGGGSRGPSIAPRGAPPALLRARCGSAWRRWEARQVQEPPPSDWRRTHRPRAKPSDVITTLRHFAIVTYAVPPERVAGLVDERFALDTIQVDGQERALISVVPFEDEDFRWAASDGPRWRFGQTNYRIYVRDRQTGKRAVWFLGTTLGSGASSSRATCGGCPGTTGDSPSRANRSWTASTRPIASRPAAAGRRLALELDHDADAPLELPGFADTKTALDVLTHPLDGFFRRRDGHLGTYSVWHERLAPTPGRVRHARIGLFDRLGIVPFAEQAAAHSVLIQPRTEFQIHLPPRRC